MSMHRQCCCGPAEPCDAGDLPACLDVQFSGIEILATCTASGQTWTAEGYGFNRTVRVLLDSVDGTGVGHYIASVPVYFRRDRTSPSSHTDGPYLSMDVALYARCDATLGLRLNTLTADMIAAGSATIGLFGTPGLSTYGPGDTIPNTQSSSSPFVCGMIGEGSAVVTSPGTCPALLDTFVAQSCMGVEPDIIVDLGDRADETELYPYDGIDTYEIVAYSGLVSSGSVAWTDVPCSGGALRVGPASSPKTQTKRMGGAGIAKVSPLKKMGMISEEQLDAMGADRDIEAAKAKQGGCCGAPRRLD